MQRRSVRREAVKISEKKDDGAVSFAATIQCNVKKDIEDIASRTSKAISGTFGRVGKEIEDSVSKPAEKARESVSKSMESINKSVQSVSKGSKGFLDSSVENAKLKVSELERELESVNAKLDSMRNTKIKSIESLWGDNRKGMLQDAESSLSKDKDYTKLVAQSEKINSRLLAAEEKLNLSTQIAAQKAEQKKSQERQKAADKAHKLLEQERAAAEKAEAKQVEATEKAEQKKQQARQKTAKKIASSLSSSLKGTTKGISKQVGGAVKGIGKKVSGLAKSIKSAFKSAVFMAGLYAAFRSVKDMMSNFIDQNAALKASLSQIGSNIQAAFMPMVQAALPAVNALTQGLAYLTGKIAEFTSSFFGTTVAKSTAAVKALKNTSKEAKKAASLAGIDEINNIGSDSSEENENTSSGGVGQTPAEAQGLVQKITDTLKQAASAIPAFIADALTRIAQSVPGFAKAAADIVNAFLSSLNERWEEISQAGIKIITSLLDGLISVSPQLGTTAANIVTFLLQAIFEGLPKLFEAGVQFLTNFLSGLSEKMPELMPKMKEGIDNILNTITENLPQILQSGMEILLSLINGISQCLPEITSAITKVCEQIIQVVIDNLPQIIQAGVDILVNLVKGILGSIDVIIEEAPKIIESLVKGLMDGIPILIDGAIELAAALIDAIMKTDWIQVGKDILSAIWNGIKSGAKSIWQYFFGDTHRGGGSTFFGSLYSAFPSFASGGIVRQPTLAMVGDNKRSPEAITPLHELYGLVKSAVAAGNQNTGSGQQPLSFVLQIDGERIMEWVYGEAPFGRKRGAVLVT